MAKETDLNIHSVLYMIKDATNLSKNDLLEVIDEVIMGNKELDDALLELLNDLEDLNLSFKSQNDRTIIDLEA